VAVEAPPLYDMLLSVELAKPGEGFERVLEFTGISLSTALAYAQELYKGERPVIEVLITRTKIEGGAL